MLITKEWSVPKPIAFGKDILVKSSRGNFSYRIFTATHKGVERVIHDRIHTIVADDESLRAIRFPVIAFRANTNDELHVDFEVL